VSDEHEHEQAAERIAGRGREALIARLRPAFATLAAQHADALRIEDRELEQMVQRAADRADGVQWRRALATVAMGELGIGIGEALKHPAVVRAHTLLGAPSFEDALGDPEPAVRRQPGPSQAPPSPAVAPGQQAPVPGLSRRGRFASVLGRYRRP
jgi:hypothetical protein